MPNGLVVLRRRIALAFLGDDMQHFGTTVVLDLAQNTHEPDHVMSVRRTEITDVETREDIARLLAESGFETVVAAQDGTSLALIYQMQLGCQLVQTPTQTVVSGAGRQIHQVLRETAFERVDRHMVVIEHDEQVVLVHRGVVQSLECQTARHRSIAYDCHDVAR